MLSIKKYIICFFILGGVWMFSCSRPAAQKSELPSYPITDVPFTDVKVTGGFWLPYLERNHQINIVHNLQQCKRTGRLDNFYVAAGQKEGKYSGHHTSADSDVFKTIDGIARSLALYPDAALQASVDSLIDGIAGAQEADGYLYTPRTISPNKPPKQAGATRWAYLTDSHELYNVGHLYEAALSYYQATGKRKLLDVALKNADMLCQTFGPDKRIDIPGHQEVEIGLVKLYQLTGQEKYIRLAEFFLEQRGQHANGRPIYTYTADIAQVQDHLPVVEQTEARGHAVRLGYQAVAMADVAVLGQKKEYMPTLEKLWEDVVYRKMYLTGAIGCRKEGESFDAAYVLPNKDAYAETCASIGSVLWQYRMFLAHGDAKYLDVLERTLYNGVIASPTILANQFFYVNPLASDGKYTRKPWYGVPCCPTNIGRTVPSIQGYAYAHQGDVIFVNLFLQSETDISMGAGKKVHLTQTTNYPQDGKIQIEVAPEKEQTCELRIRIPGWATGKPVPGDLYRYLNNQPENCILKVNDSPVALNMDKGFARIQRTWKKGDKVTLEIPMSIRRVLANEQVQADINKVALEYGPVVYCIENEDNAEDINQITLPDNQKLTMKYDKELLSGTYCIVGEGIKAIPYNKWALRKKSQMAVWINRGTNP